MSVGCGLYFNQSLLTQAAGSMVIGEEQYQIGPDWYQFAAVAFVIHFVSIVLMVILTSKGGKKKAHAWAASAGADASTKNVGLLGCLTVLLPVTPVHRSGYQPGPRHLPVRAVGSDLHRQPEELEQNR